MKNKLIATIEMVNGFKILIVDTVVYGIDVVAVILVNDTGLIVNDAVFTSEREARTAIFKNFAQLKTGDFSSIKKSSAAQ